MFVLYSEIRYLYVKCVFEIEVAADFYFLSAKIPRLLHYSFIVENVTGKYFGFPSVLRLFI